MRRPVGQRLTGKVALITGGSRGIGAAIAKRLAADGARVVIGFATNRPAADSVVQAIRGAGVEAHPIQADITQAAERRRLIDEAIRRFGRIDILINSAAIVQAAVLEDVDEALFNQHFDTNLKAAFFMSQAAAAVFGQDGGAIVNISSIATRSATPQFIVYAAAKAALEMLTITMSRHLGPRGIRVNAVAPGQTATEMLLQVVPEEMIKDNVDRTSLKRMGTPEDIADVVAFLVSDDARWVTGETIHVNGGQRN